MDLDEWTPVQLQTMKLGGNLNARNFFRKHGVAPDAKVGRGVASAAGGPMMMTLRVCWHADWLQAEAKYTSRAAEMYKTHLAKLVQENTHVRRSKHHPSIHPRRLVRAESDELGADDVVATASRLAHGLERACGRAGPW